MLTWLVLGISAVTLGISTFVTLRTRRLTPKPISWVDSTWMDIAVGAPGVVCCILRAVRREQTPGTDIILTFTSRGGVPSGDVRGGPFVYYLPDHPEKEAARAKAVRGDS